MSIARKEGYIDKIVDGKKLCTSCKEIKLLIEFNRSSIRTNHYQLWCKKCGNKAKSTAYHSYRKPFVRLLARQSQLKTQYRMSLEDYDTLFKLQEGRCGICKRKPTKGGNQFVKGILCVDHNKITGQTRGLLCSNCNLGIGLFEENIDFLYMAVEYLNLFGLLPLLHKEHTRGKNAPKTP